MLYKYSMELLKNKDIKVIINRNTYVTEKQIIHLAQTEQ